MERVKSIELSQETPVRFLLKVDLPDNKHMEEYIELREHKGGWYCNHSINVNDYLFGFLEGDHKYIIQESILGYTHYNGIFPYCNTYEDARSLLLHLVARIKEAAVNQSIEMGEDEEEEEEDIKLNFKI